jgi:hypothetical protein
VIQDKPQHIETNQMAQLIYLFQVIHEISPATAISDVFEFSASAVYAYGPMHSAESFYQFVHSCTRPAEIGVDTQHDIWIDSQKFCEKFFIFCHQQWFTASQIDVFQIGQIVENVCFQLLPLLCAGFADGLFQFLFPFAAVFGTTVNTGEITSVLPSDIHVLQLEIIAVVQAHIGIFQFSQVIYPAADDIEAAFVLFQSVAGAAIIGLMICQHLSSYAPVGSA